MRLREDGVAWQEIDGELVILDLVGSAYLTTNRAGALLAHALREERSAADLSDVLVREFDIDADRAETDVAAFVAQLDAKGLLVR